VSKIDIEFLRRWVGRERAISDDLHPFQAQAFAAALDRPVLPQRGHVLPPSWQWMYFLDTPTAAGTGLDGHPKLGDFLPPVPLPRRMWAAGSFRIERPLHIGRPAEKNTVIKSIDLKEGKTGALVFVNLEHSISQ
jgi:3-methylfumaryl-CoA hydratase